MRFPIPAAPAVHLSNLSHALKGENILFVSLHLFEIEMARRSLTNTQSTLQVNVHFIL